jgi:molybdopterin-guanine dinucleotide biosynthesis protein A
MYAIILAKGEKSRRLGRIKALIKINGSTIIEKIVNEIKKCFKKILVVTTDVKKFKKIKYVKVVEDKYKIGPLGGILTGLKNSPYKYNFVIACDYPFVKKEVVEYMMNIKNDYEILIPKNKNSIHPLFAIYSKELCPLIERNLKMGRYKVFGLVKKANVKYVEDIPDFEKVFFNLNTEKDLEPMFEIRKWKN